MTDIDARTGLPESAPLTLTHVIYGLHAWSAVTGLLTPALVVTAFLSGWPSIIAVVLNYANRDAAAGTWLDSHFRWQIRTFWFALLWLTLGGAAFLTVIGIPLAFALWGLTGVWVIDRIARGWIALADHRPLPA